MSVIPNILMEHERRIIDTAVELIDGCFEKDTIINALYESVASDGCLTEVSAFEAYFDENYCFGFVYDYYPIVVFEHLNNDRILVGA